MDPFCYLCFVSVMLSCLFIAAMWSPAGKGLTSWLLCVRCFLVFLSHSHVVSWVRCYLVVLIPDLSLLPYFKLWTCRHMTLSLGGTLYKFKQILF